MEIYFSVSAEGTIKSIVLDGNQVLISNFVEHIKVSFSPVGNRLRIFFFFFLISILRRSCLYGGKRHK
jgi:hypothetical protein